jgi:alpha-tubulin suppressor-like RCC1 family protein
MLYLQYSCIKEGASMRNVKVITLFILVVLAGSVVAKATDAGSIVSWGAIAFDSKEPDANDFVTISAGVNSSLALKSNGSIIGWGDNYYGQATPPDGNDFAAISAGDSYSLALKSDGSIVGWGANHYGQATPPEGNDFIAIAAGYLQSLAIRKEPSEDELVED